MKGCAMRTICVPTYVNIFMVEFEEKYTYPFIKQISMLCLRFVDDIFMICIKSENELKNLMKDLNTKHPSIRFDFKYSKEKIEFLNTLIYKDQLQKLQTTLNLKPADSQNYLSVQHFKNM